MKLNVTQKTKSIISPSMTESDKFFAVLNMHLATYLRGSQYGELQSIGHALCCDWYGDFKPQNPGRFWYEETQCS